MVQYAIVAFGVQSTVALQYAGRERKVGPPMC